jgi:hypothetical protein
MMSGLLMMVSDYLMEKSGQLAQVPAAWLSGIFLSLRTTWLQRLNW